MARTCGRASQFVRARAWLWGDAGLGAALILLFTFGPFEVLIPYVVKNDLDGGAAVSGPCSRPPARLVFGAMLLGRIGLPRRRITFMWSAWCVGDVLFIGFAFTDAAWQMCLISFVAFGLVDRRHGGVEHADEHASCRLSCWGGCRASTGSSRSG